MRFHIFFVLALSIAIVQSRSTRNEYEEKEDVINISVGDVTTTDQLNSLRCTSTDGTCHQSNNVIGFPDLRVIGGKEALPMHKYPWMVGLTNTYYYPETFCGGTIINDLYVLTAAHCLSTMSPENHLYVIVADHNVSSEKDDVRNATQIIGIEEMCFDKRFDLFDHFHGYDIALLKLKKRLNLVDYKEIKAICLPKNNMEDYAGWNGTIVGRGCQEFGNSQSSSDALMEGNLPIFSNQDCQQSGTEYGMNIADNVLCAGSPSGGVNACFGDSGGPLVVMKNDMYTQVGITSFGHESTPTVFTRVSVYHDWINEHTSGSNICFH